MSRVCTLIVLAAFACCLGCGKSEPVAQGVQPSPKQPATAESTPAEIVSQFLDRVRRGGEDSRAGQLLTETAQAELARIGRSIQPIGSPDASFQVTRSEQVPDDEGASLVQSIWSEPNPDGTQSSYEVVWAVQREPVGWRISGLAMRMNDGDQPMIINFEDGELMAKILADEPPGNTSGNPSQAAAPRQSLER